jgi:tRNA G46 methylase TrmB
MELDFALKNSGRLIVEFGMGDGVLLKKLVEYDYDIKLIPNMATVTYVGIEINKNEFKIAKSRMSNHKNVILLNAPLEEIMPLFPNTSIDQILSVLPDPNYVDKSKESQWKSFYETCFSKLKNHGLFRLVTEMTNELLEPISDEAYETWIQWLSQSLQSIGFTVKEITQLSPEGYTTRFLTQFKGDVERIRIATLDLIKDR